MNKNDIYKVKAEAFYIMTGHTAPGNGELCPKCKQEWGQWLQDNDKCIRAMVLAFNSVMDNEIP